MIQHIYTSKNLEQCLAYSECSMMIIILSVLWGTCYELSPFTYCFISYESEITKSIFQRGQLRHRGKVTCPVSHSQPEVRLGF